jgi:urease accessory protein
MTAHYQMLRALQHSDSQFPSGGFAFSQGLESSSQLVAQLGEFDLANFLHSQIVHRWADGDRVALVRAHRCGFDFTALADLDAEVEASTFSDSLRLGSKRNGIALLTTHERIGTPQAQNYRAMIRSGAAHGHLMVVQGLLWRAIEIDETTATLISGYQAATSLTTAAIRLGLVGAIEAQKLLERTFLLIECIVALPVADDEPVRSFVPLTEIAIAMHGASGQRLFSN